MGASASINKTLHETTTNVVNKQIKSSTSSVQNEVGVAQTNIAEDLHVSGCLFKQENKAQITIKVVQNLTMSDTQQMAADISSNIKTSLDQSSAAKSSGLFPTGISMSTSISEVSTKIKHNISSKTVNETINSIINKANANQKNSLIGGKFNACADSNDLVETAMDHYNQCLAIQSADACKIYTSAMTPCPTIPLPVCGDQANDASINAVSTQIVNAIVSQINQDKSLITSMEAVKQKSEAINAGLFGGGGMIMIIVVVMVVMMSMGGKGGGKGAAGGGGGGGGGLAGMVDMNKIKGAAKSAGFKM